MNFFLFKSWATVLQTHFMCKHYVCSNTKKRFLTQNIKVSHHKRIWMYETLSYLVFAPEKICGVPSMEVMIHKG